MKTVLAAAIFAATIGATALGTTPASADRLYLSFSSGDVAFAYRDGWWDRDHRWHHWRDRDEWREYRVRHYPYYSDWDHDRDGDGWREAEWRERWRGRGEDWREHERWRDHHEDWRDHRDHREDWRDHHDDHHD